LEKNNKNCIFSHQILESIRFGNLVTDWVLESGFLGKPDQPKNGADNKASLYFFNFFFTSKIEISKVPNLICH